MNAGGKEVLRFSFNLIFAVYNCILGLTSHSIWFLTMGGYYTILSIMRVSVITFARKDRKNEFFIMKFIGAMIFVLSLILCFIVYMTVGQDGATKYHEIVMITIALYAFTKITLAIIGFVKSRKSQRPYKKTLRSIAVTDSVVSIYSLQRSMLVTFDGMAPGDIMLMNTLSGIGMCIVVIGIGLNLVLGGRKNGKIKSGKEC